jgi:GT2 family glycosyltransferase
MTLQALDTLLPEVRALNEAKPGSAKVCIVDNDSQDGSEDKLKAGVTARGADDVVFVVQSGHNGGYGFGNNVALRLMLEGEHKADYAYLLNSDAFVEGHALQTLIDYCDAHTDVGIAGGYIHGTDGEPHPGAFHYPTIWSEIEGSVRFAPLSKLLKDKVVPQPVPEHTVTDVDWVPGASRRSASSTRPSSSTTRRPTSVIARRRPASRSPSSARPASPTSSAPPPA